MEVSKSIFKRQADFLEKNGKVERSHRLDSEFYARKKFLSYEKMIRSVKKNCSRYNNTARKVLGFKTPNQLVLEYKEKVEFKN